MFQIFVDLDIEIYQLWSKKITLCNFAPTIKIAWQMANLCCLFYLRGFNAKSVLSCFLHFCVEQKLTHKSCLWSKNDKKDVC